MTKEVLVAVKGLQFASGEEGEEIESIYPGQYYEKNGARYILYEEPMEGYDQVTKVTIKIKPTELVLTKKGIINVRMDFVEKQKNMTNYQTPFGSLLFGVDTSSIQIQEKEDDLQIQVDYVLDLNYEYLSDCKIEILVKPKEEGIALQ